MFPGIGPVLRFFRTGWQAFDSIGRIENPNIFAPPGSNALVLHRLGRIGLTTIVFFVQ